MLTVGDTVLYGVTGVCRVDGMRELDSFGKKKLYYVLKPLARDKSAVYVPADNELLKKKVRKVLSREEILETIDGVGAKENIWENDDAKRYELFSGIIRGGDLKNLIVLVRTLREHREKRLSDGKRLRISDERFLTEGERLLKDEISAVFDISPSDVPNFVASRIDGPPDETRKVE